MLRHNRYCTCRRYPPHAQKVGISNEFEIHVVGAAYVAQFMNIRKNAVSILSFLQRSDVVSDS